MITSLYASLLALSMVRLSVSAIKLRRKNRISVGDELALRAHSNAVEYIPISLVPVLTLELNGAPQALIHVFEATLLHPLCAGASRPGSQDTGIGPANNALSVNRLGVRRFV